MLEGKKEIITRLIIVYILVLLVWAIAIISQMVKIQFVEGEFWRKKAAERTVALRDVKAQRGNIFSSDGKLLAITVPIFSVALDLGKESIYDKELKEYKMRYIIPDSIFKPQLNKLCDSLADLFPQKSASEYKKILQTGRNKSQRYVPLLKNVSLEQLERMKSFPILKKEVRKRKPRPTANNNTPQDTIVKKPAPAPQFNRAVIFEQFERRINPYGTLGRRTVGIKVTQDGCDTCYNGLDGAYNLYLKGKKGKRMERRMNQNVWVPIENEEYARAEDGNDIISTIDVRIQQLAENSLRRCLDSNDADKGCVVLMEVETGFIRAISSLTRTETGQYIELENIAVSDRYEPGSTFKLITTMIMLENKICDTAYQVPTGEYKFRGITEVKDVNRKNYGSVSLKRAFEVSSNVGICFPIFNYYKDKKKEFLNQVTNTFPFQKLNLDIAVNEATPTIVSDMRPDVNFLNICYGYGVDMSVLQLLTFYNAIANNGKMVKPMFASHILQAGDTIAEFKPQVLNDNICSEKTLKQLQDLLKCVVKNGSARKLSKTPYGIAGKTGTAQSGYEINKIFYRASFAGYFPANDPKYSCMVLVINPKKNKTHGGELAAPVFKEIADRVCGTRLDIEIPIIANEDRKWPVVPKAYQPDLEVIFETLQIPFLPKGKDKWINAAINENDSVEYKPMVVNPNVVPLVYGMTIKDALYILENMGLKVGYSGRGKVVKQSIPNGNSFKKGDVIYLTLN